MTTENLTSLKIHKLTNKTQYDKAGEEGVLESNALYLTPEEPLDLSGYLTRADALEEYTTKAEAEVIRTKHAGGTLVELNGESKAEKTATFYAPIASGSAASFLQSQGEKKTPLWRTPTQVLGDLGFTGSVTSIISNTLTGDRVVITNSQGKITTAPDITSDYLQNLPGTIASTLEQSKIYTINAVTQAKNDLLGGAGDNYNSLKKLGDLIDANKGNIDLLTETVNGKENEITILPIGKGGTGANVASVALENLGGAPLSHASSSSTYGLSTATLYGHAKASDTIPNANGTASAGDETNSFARGDHIHPLQTSVSGNAGSANKVNNTLTITLNSGTTEDTDFFTFDGSASTEIDITPAIIGAEPKITGAASSIVTSSLTPNRIVKAGDDGKITVSSKIYALDDKLAINSTAVPDENLYVNGTSKLDGATSVDTLTISSTATTSHLNFSRSDNPNYIKAPFNIGFCIGNDLKLEKCSLVVASNYISPGATGSSSLGSENYRWESLYMDGSIHLQGSILFDNADSYGPELPASGTAGQVFFKVIG